MGRVWMFRKILRLGRGIWDSNFIMFFYDYGVMIDAQKKKKLEYQSGSISPITRADKFNPTCFEAEYKEED